MEQGRGLCLFGTWGTGKTQLGIATVRNLIELNPELFGARENELDIYDPDRLNYYGLYCSFFSTVDLLDALRPGSEAKQQKAEQLFHRAKTDHLIVLDDIGAEKPTVWVEDRLFTLVDLRYRTERATIFTSNCTEEELNNRLGGRLVSRIFEMAEPVQVTGPDHRRS
jgi:DNA replication protein DnaC